MGLKQRNSRKRQASSYVSRLSKKQRLHLKEYGESHPVDQCDDDTDSYKFKAVEVNDTEVPDQPVGVSPADSSSDGEDLSATTAYEKLLALCQSSRHSTQTSTSDESDGEESDHEDEEVESGEDNDEAVGSNDEAVGSSEDDVEAVGSSEDYGEAVGSSEDDGEAVGSSEDDGEAVEYDEDDGDVDEDDDIKSGEDDVDAVESGEDDGEAVEPGEDDGETVESSEYDSEAVESSEDHAQVGDNCNIDELSSNENKEMDDDCGRAKCDQDDAFHHKDPFLAHFERELDEEFVQRLHVKESWSKSIVELEGLGMCQCTFLDGMISPPSEVEGTEIKYMKQGLLKSVPEVAQQVMANHTKSSTGKMSALQSAMLRCLSQYRDFYFPNRTIVNQEELRMVYALHILNHALKTRLRVIGNSMKMKKMQKDSLHEFRDQGFTRPKTLILVPFRESALRIVNMLAALLSNKKKAALVSNRRRFEDEFRRQVELPSSKPDDYLATFAGSSDDHFRVGVSVARGTLKLYADFFESDVVIASPLGLRTLIADGEERGEEHGEVDEADRPREFDFLSSIEVLVLDQADAFLMQNWENISIIMDHMNLQPKESHGADFSRIRMWTLNGWSKYYRQTIVLSGIQSPEINAIVNRHCTGWAGRVSIEKIHLQLSINLIVPTLQQMFHRVDCQTYSDLPDLRFDCFLKTVYPQYREETMQRTLIYIPSYFDFVRLRNHFRSNHISFAAISEYSHEKNLKHARKQFKNGSEHFLLYTERFHFFRRFRLQGIKHIIFYDVPTYSHFYSEIANMLLDLKKTNQNENFHCSVIYSKFDALKLFGIIGSQRTKKMLLSDKNVHMFVSNAS